MSKDKNCITVFEHDPLKLNKDGFNEKQLLALQKFHGDKGTAFFSLIHKGVKFNSHVGVIKVGKLSIEVLPKADKYSSDKDTWRKLLIDMMRSVGLFTIHAPTSAALSIKNDFILDLYFDLFLTEVEYLFHKGLIKKYRKTEGNKFALKGSLLFSKHLQQNLVHQERFYVRHSIYDQEHLLHQLLYKTLLLLKRINTNMALKSRIGALLLHFPEMKNLTVTEATFNKIVYNRKTESYQQVMKIVRLLLLNYHPDLSRGQNDVLALMFDMNALWERFVYVSLRKSNELSVTAQSSKGFWKPNKGRKSRLKPDIIFGSKDKNDKRCVVLDTKWKNLNGRNPSPDDLRQMYAYHDFFGANRVALVYPGRSFMKLTGKFLDPVSGEETKKVCSVISLAIEPEIKKWQKRILKELTEVINYNSEKENTEA